MPGLRALIDCKALDTKDHNDVFDHLKKAKDAKTDHDIATLKLHQKLAPARQMIEMIDQEHPLPGAEQQVDEFGNPIQNNQLQPGQQVNPMNQQQQNNQQMRQAGKMPGAVQQPTMKQPAPKKALPKVGNKSSNGKDKSDSKPKKGFEVHIRGGGLGSGRHKVVDNYRGHEIHKDPDGTFATIKNGQLTSSNHNSLTDAKYFIRNGTRLHAEEDDSETIDQMNVKGKKRKDYHSDAGFPGGGGRGIGMSTARSMKCQCMKAYKAMKGSMNAGKYSMQAKAPKGWEGTVKHMKSHPEITNPWALSHWMKDEGYHSHKG